MERLASRPVAARRRAALVLSLFALLLPACGGGGQDDPGGPPGDPAILVTPPPGAFLLGNTASIRGTTSPSLQVVDVRVNGFIATSTDGFRTFAVDVPLVPGRNDIEASVLTATGEVFGPDLIGILENVGPVLTTVSDFALDETNDRLFVLDGTTRGLFACDLTTGAKTAVSTAAVGTGPGFDFSAFAVTLDVAGNRAFVQNGVSALLAVDLATGNRTPVTDPFGAPIQGREIEYDPASGEVIYTVEQPPDTFLLSVDPGTGNVSPVASFLGNPGPVGGLSLTLDGAGGILAAAPDLATVFAVSPAGAVSVLSDATTGIGPGFVEPTGIARDDVTGRIYVSERDLSSVLEVDALTGDRIELSAGPMSAVAPRLARVAVDGNRNRLVIGGLDRVEGVDLGNGLRTLLFAPERGTGAAVDYSFLAVDRGRRIGYAATNPGLGPPGITAIDLRTGNRTPVVPSLASVQALAFDGAGDRLLAATQDAATLEVQVVEIDTTTGATSPLIVAPGTIVLDDMIVTPDGAAAFLGYADRLDRLDLGTLNVTTVTGASVGTGPTYGGGTLAWDDGGSVLFAAAQGTVLSVDPASGARAVVSSGVVGSGPNFTFIQRIRFDPETGHLVLSPVNFFVDSIPPFVTRDELLALDPATGVRSVLRSGVAGELATLNDFVVTEEGTILATLGRSFDALVEFPTTGPGATAIVSRRIASPF